MHFNNKLEIMQADPLDLLSWLVENFSYDIPINIEYERELRLAGNLLGEIMNTYAFLTQLNIELEIRSKILKLNIPHKSDPEFEVKKTESELMALRKKVVGEYADLLSKQYTCISRMVTVKTEADKELHMSDSK